MRALVAVEHALIITAWNLLTDGAFYRELGADYYTVRKPAKAKHVRSVSSKRSATPSRSHARRHRITAARGVSGGHPLGITIFSYECALSPRVLMRGCGGVGVASWRRWGFGCRPRCPQRGRQPGSVNELLDAPTCLSFDTLPVVTGPDNQASCLSVVVGVGRVHTTTSGRARR